MVDDVPSIQESFWMVYVAFSSPGSFEMYFHVQISLYESEKAVVFFWYGQNQKGVGETDILDTFERFGEVRVRRCALGGVLLV